MEQAGGVDNLRKQADMAQTSRPCDGCGNDVPRTRPTGAIPRYCGDECKPRCSIEGCDSPVRKRDWCSNHYSQQRYTGQPPEPFKWKWGQEAPRPYIARKPKPPRLCSVDGCGKPHTSLGLCSKHETRFRRHGDPLAAIRTVREDDVPCVVCGNADKQIRSRFLCSKRCERLYYTYGGSVPTEHACAQCGTIVPLGPSGRTGRRRKASSKLCPKCQRNSWRAECMTVDELAARDGFFCSVCSEPVDLNLRRSDSFMCPSIDHIIPRSMGGGNEPENLALAHLICNIRKSNKAA